MSKFYKLQLTLLFTLTLTNIFAINTGEQGYFFRANGTSKQTIILNENGGKLISDNSEDNLTNIVISEPNSLGAKKITFSRVGTYNQQFTGWISGNEQQITGYYTHQGNELPFHVITEADVINANPESFPQFVDLPNISKKWFIRCNGTATGELIVEGEIGTIQFGTAGPDNISNITFEQAGDLGAYKVTFERTGSYNQTFVGWLSSNRAHISGYYIHNGEELPFHAMELNEEGIEDITEPINEPGQGQLPTPAFVEEIKDNYANSLFWNKEDDGKLFDTEKPIAIFIHGGVNYGNSVKDVMHTNKFSNWNMGKYYWARSGETFDTNTPDHVYDKYGVLNEGHAESCAKLLIRIIEYYSINNTEIRFIGNSWGSHIATYAGKKILKYVKERGLKILVSVDLTEPVMDCILDPVNNRIVSDEGHYEHAWSHVKRSMQYIATNQVVKMKEGQKLFTITGGKNYASGIFGPEFVKLVLVDEDIKMNSKVYIENSTRSHVDSSGLHNEARDHYLNNRTLGDGTKCSDTKVFINAAGECEQGFERGDQKIFLLDVAWWQYDSNTLSWGHGPIIYDTTVSVEKSYPDFTKPIYRQDYYDYCYFKNPARWEWQYLYSWQRWYLTGPWYALRWTYTWEKAYGWVLVPASNWTCEPRPYPFKTLVGHENYTVVEQHPGHKVWGFYNHNKRI